MIFTDQMKNLKIYKKPLFLPTLDTDKKKDSIIFLLTPNYNSSKKLMQHPLIINRLRYQSYYIERDLSYIISTKGLENIEENTNYVFNESYSDLYHNLNEMTALEKNKLKDSDFGLPKLKKYPLNDKKHVLSAIRFFNYVSTENEKELADNINKKIKEYNMSNISVGDKNRFKKYYNESTILLENASNIDGIIKSLEDILKKENIKLNVSKNGEWGINNFKSGKSNSLCLGSYKKEDYDKVYKIVKDALPDNYKVSKDNYYTLFIRAKKAVKESEEIPYDKITNDATSAIESVSGTIKYKNGNILVLYHKKCNAISIPGGKVNSEDHEDIFDALKRELKEELDIEVLKARIIDVNTFLCKYPADSDTYTYFKDYNFEILEYAGTIKNNEPNKHDWLEYRSIDELLKENITIVLRNSIEALKNEAAKYDTTDSDYYSISNHLLFEGYAKDVNIIKNIITPKVYLQILTRLELKYNSLDEIPNLALSIHPESDNDNIEYNLYKDNEVMVPIPSYNDSMDIENYLSIVICRIMTGLLCLSYPGIEKSYIVRIIVDYLMNMESIYSDWGRYLLEDKGYSIHDLCTMDSSTLYQELLSVNHGIKMDDILINGINTEAAISMENLSKKFKYMTSEKIKRKYSDKTKSSKRLLNKLKDEFIKFKFSAPSMANSSSSNSSSNQVKENMIENLTEEDGVLRLNNNIVLFTEDTNPKYGNQLRRLLYADRIKQRKEVLMMNKDIKAELPFIKYAYPDIDTYKSKNLFYDLYFYNELFFKNNTWKMKKGFDLYLELLNRLINNPSIPNSYKKKTIFIPILDWDINRSTRMWMYRESINPISIIYELMNTQSTKLKEVFKDIDIIFFSSDKYFKLNFSDISLDDYKKKSFTFRNFIIKIQKNQEFDEDDIDTTFDNVESNRAIKANVMDKIEIAKGVDLTGKDVKLNNDFEEIRKKYKKVKDVPVAVTTDIPVKTINDIKKDTKKDIDKKVSSIDKDKENKKQVEKEVELTKIARQIDNMASDSSINSTDELLDKMNNDIELKRMIIDLDSYKPEGVQINSARSARINELDKELLDKNIMGKSIKDILNEDPNKEELETTSLNIASPNEEWKNLKYMNFDKDYDLNRDIINCFRHFSTVSLPISIRNIDVKDNSTSEDRLDLYDVDMEDFRGKRFNIKLDIPKAKDNRFLLRGNVKSIQTQFFNMPILKTDLDTCQIISNYQKIFIRRFNTAAGRSTPYVTYLMKVLSKYDGKNIVISYGDNTKICNKYELPIDYIDLASVYNSIEIYNTEDNKSKITIYFNQDEIRSKYTDLIDETQGIPVGYNEKDKSIMYIIRIDKYTSFAKSLIDMISYNDQKFADLYYAVKGYTSGTYSRCSILNTEIPLVVICGYLEGLTATLKKANIDYKLSEKRNKDYDKSYYDYIKFSDGYLYYHIDYAACMLLNGLKDCSTEIYSMMDIDKKTIYLEMLDDFGGRIKADGLDNFYDCLVDPMTRETLEYYKLPTDFISILLYANMLLTDNKYTKHTDSSSRRIRRTEMIAAYTYEALSEAYGTWANEIRHNKNSVFSIKQSIVIDKFLLSPISSDDSIINALNAVETTNAITFKGKAGLNNDRSYSLDKRTYDDSMINVIGMSTGFSANVGITRQATMDMNVQGSRGYIKSSDGDTSKMNSAKSLCATEALTPFGSTRDDAPRTSMTFIQTAKHSVRTEKSDPLLVTNGADEALAYMTTDKFAFKAKDDGFIKELTDDYVIIEYKNGSKDYINLKETVEKNSDGGFYVPLKLDISKGIKEGKRIHKEDIIAYDKLSFSNSVGESDNIAYNVGKLAKIAIINTDDGYEDAGICTESLSHKLATKIIMKMDHTIDKDANIFKIVKIGDEVDVDDALIVWQDPHDEEDANVLLRIMGNDQETVSELGRKTVRSEIAGKIVDIKIYRTVDIDQLSPSLQKIVKTYEKPISELKKKLESEGLDTNELPANYKLAPTGKLKKAQDAVFFEFFVEYTDIIAVGDKITYYSANKATIKNVLPQELAPTTDFRPHEPIEAFVSQTSIDKRMVTSTLVYGSIQKLMVELDRSVKDMLGIKYDDSQV